MIADTQVHIDSWGIWPVYFLGQFLHILSIANAAVHSKANSIQTFKEYFILRWVPITCRIFLSAGAFALIWDNDSIIDMDKYISGTRDAIGFAAILGFFSDSFLDKVLNMLSGVIPGLQKEVPVIPQDPNP